VHMETTTKGESSDLHETSEEAKKEIEEPNHTETTATSEHSEILDEAKVTPSHNEKYRLSIEETKVTTNSNPNETEEAKKQVEMTTPTETTTETTPNVEYSELKETQTCTERTENPENTEEKNCSNEIKEETKAE